MKAWLKRFQEFMGWMPLLGIIALAAWVVLGGMSTGTKDLIRRLLDLPVAALYALAASGLSYLVWRRWSFRMTDDELIDYKGRLFRGERGPMLIFIINSVFYLCVFGGLLVFFYRY